MKLTIIESPYSGDVPLHTAYAHKCLRHSINLGETPSASPHLYTQVLDDTIPQDRNLGLTLGFTYYHHASLCAVYIDHGISNGMHEGIRAAERLGVPVIYRKLPNYKPS